MNHRRAVLEQTKSGNLSNISVGLTNPTTTGIYNGGNSCYMTAGLNMLAFTPYRQLFPNTNEDSIIGKIGRILHAIGNGQAVTGETINELRKDLDEAKLLPPPALLDIETARTAQQDPSEVFRNILATLVQNAKGFTLSQTVSTQFTGDLTLIPDQQVQSYSTIDQKTKRLPDNTHTEFILELSINGKNTLAEAMQGYLAPEKIEGVKGVWNGTVMEGNAERTIQPGQENSDVITFALKRFEGLHKESRDIDIGDTITINDNTYVLRTVVYHLGSAIGSGHYTANTYNETTGSWQYRDDQMVYDDGNHEQRRKQGYMFTYVKQ